MVVVVAGGLTSAASPKQTDLRYSLFAMKDQSASCGPTFVFFLLFSLCLRVRVCLWWLRSCVSAIASTLHNTPHNTLQRDIFAMCRLCSPFSLFSHIITSSLIPFSCVLLWYACPLLSFDFFLDVWVVNRERHLPTNCRHLPRIMQSASDLPNTLIISRPYI